MERQPKYWVKMPPAKGPTAKPIYTAATTIPKTRPRCLGKKAETKMAGPVVLVNAPPIPWIYRAKISQNPETAVAQAKDASVNIIMPILKTRRIPVKSPKRPTGKRNIAVANKKEVTVQLSVTALSSKVFSISGKAMFMDEIKNDPIKAVMATMPIMEICRFEKHIFL